MSALTSTSLVHDAPLEDVDSATFRTGDARRAVFVEAAANLMADLPTPVKALVRLASSGQTDLAAMECAFDEQPLVAESVLSLARALMSPYQACETVADVISVLGPRTLGVLAAASVATGMLERGAPTAHAMGRAMTIAALCRRVAPIARASADDASLCGLLSNVGEAMLLRQRRGVLAGLVDGGSDDDRIDRERALFGFDHAALGESALRSWGATEDVAFAVRYHHDVVSALGAGTRVTRLVGVVRFCTALTRRIADARGAGPELIDRIVREESAAHLPLGAPSTDELCRAVGDAFVPYALASHHALGVDTESLDDAALANNALRCSICDGPASGTNCPCCDHDVCLAHETGHAWCLRCEANYIVERGRPERALFTTVAATMFIVGVSIATGRIRENLLMREISALALCVCGLATIAALCVRGVRRARFRSAEKGMKRERAMLREAVAPPTPSDGAKGIRAPALKADAKIDSKTIRTRESVSSVTKVRKVPAKTAKKKTLVKVKKAPAKTRAKRVSRPRTSTVARSQG